MFNIRHIHVIYFNFRGRFQKKKLLGVVEQFITENDYCKDVHVACGNCSYESYCYESVQLLCKHITQCEYIIRYMLSDN